MSEAEAHPELPDFDENDKRVYTAEELQELGMVRIREVSSGMGLDVIYLHPSFLGKGRTVYVFEKRGEGYAFNRTLTAGIGAVIYSDNGLVRFA